MSGKKLTLNFAKAAKGMAPVGGAPDEQGIRELSDDELDKVSGGGDIWTWQAFRCNKCGGEYEILGGNVTIKLQCRNCGNQTRADASLC